MFNFSTLILSIKIWPLVGSIKPKITFIKVDFPDPDPPIIPIFFPFSISNEILFKTNFCLPGYLKKIFFSSIFFLNFITCDLFDGFVSSFFFY